MRSRALDGDFLTEVLNLLGNRDPLWQRELIPEAELLSITRDRRELARVLDRIARMDGVLVHVRNTKKGRFWFLEKADTTCVAGTGKGMAAHSHPPRRGDVHEAPADLSPEDEEESIRPDPTVTGKVPPRLFRNVLASALILADEPTGSLDSASTEAVLDSFDEIVREGTTLLVATHDPRVAGHMRRIIHMRDGALGTEPIPAMPMKLSQSNSAP